MAGYAVKKIDEMEAVYLGAFKRARAELGVESFGLQVIDMPPSYDGYPEHDHAGDGQEEVYVVPREAARSRSRASASRSTPTTWPASPPASPARCGPARRACEC